MDITPLNIVFTYVLILIGGMLIFFAVAHILYQKRSPTSMLSWMLSIFIFPYLVAPLYFIIGIRKRESKHKKEFVTFDDIRHTDAYKANDPQHALQNLLHKNGIAPPTQGNTFKLISDSTEAYQIMLEQIEQAEYQIDFCTYLFEFDATTEVILEALKKKAEEGVKVRLLLDLVGSLAANFRQNGFQSLRDAGAEVAFFTPMLKRPFQNYINLRNHRKIYLFDQKTLLSGGMNLSNDYMGKADGSRRWEDLLYCLQGPSVYYFYHIFQNDWAFATNEDLVNDIRCVDRFEGDTTAQVVPSGPDIARDALYEALLNAIYNAKERIWIVTPYFVPDENMIQALIIAYHKGVDVKLITPKDSDHLLADMGRSPYMRELHEIGADVVLYEGKMLHAKAILFDHSGGMVGSVNFDNRSLFLNYEVVTFVYSEAFIESLESWMHTLMEHSSRGMKHPSKLREAVENILKVFAPLL